MKILAFLIIGAIIVGAIFGILWLIRLAFKAYQKWRAEDEIRDGQWEVVERVQDGFAVVFLGKPGETAFSIGNVPVTLPHYEFQDQLEELRVQAHDKAYTLNRKMLA